MKIDKRDIYLIFPTEELATALDTRESTWEEARHAYTHFGNQASFVLLFMELLETTTKAILCYSY